ncbi:hypothetical protein Q1695_003771 [Nippostrongylus brasiliensis]|nr:hypothetical protein Q1695_003771 [Nippostrongylus brasiliensis]
MKDIRIDMNEVRDMQMAVNELPTSRDTVVQSMKNLLEKNCAMTTGLTTVVNHLLFKIPALKHDVAQTSAHMKELTAMKVPEETMLGHLNLTHRWVIEEALPFKQTDLKALMSSWRMPARASKDNHVIHCVDFARFYSARIREFH